MFLNALRYKNQFDQDHHVWRFTQGTENLENFVCFMGNNQEANEMMDAVEYALTGSQSTKIVEVAIQLTDRNENSWIIERTENKDRFLRNNKELDIKDFKNSLLAVLLDLDDTFGEEAQGFTNVCSQYDLVMNKDQLEASLRDSAAASNKQLANLIATKKAETLDTCAKLFDQPLVGYDSACLALARRAKPLFQANRESIRQGRSLLASSKSLDNLTPELLDQLKIECDLIQKIEDTAAPLLDPSASPKILRDKLAKVEANLRDELRTCNISSLPVSTDHIPWKKFTSCLCKLEAHEKLIEVSEKAQSLCQDNLDPVQDNYIKTIEDLISSDSQIVSELESCISTLALQVESQKTPQKAGIADMFQKFIKPSADVETVEDEASKQGRLDTARMAVDFALARLGELHSNIKEIRGEFDELQHTLRDDHEKLVHKYGKLRELWLKLCREYKVEENITLPDLMRLICKYANMNDLYTQQKSLKSKINDRKTQLSRLEELILEWRQLTASQKDTLLNTPVILLSEAQGILRYKQKKEQQYEKLKDIRDHIRAYNALKSHIDGRKQQIQASWKQLFLDLKIPELAIDHASWQEFFAISEQISSLGSLEVAEIPPLKDEEIFKTSSCTTPLNFYRWQNQGSNKIARFSLQEALEGRDATELQILICADEQEFSALKKSGCGYNRKLTAQKNTSAAIPATSPEAKKIMKNPQQELLNLLNRGKSTTL